MPIAEIAGNLQHYQIEGPADAPVVVLSNSIGIGLEMWAPQVKVLARHFRVLRYDTRGHGLSVGTTPPQSIEDLSDDVAALLNHLSIESAHFCGLSMGGLIGMSFALHHPQRLKHLVLCNTSSRIGSHDGWSKRIDQVHALGMAQLAASIVPQIWLSKPWAQDNPAVCQVLVDLVGRSDPAGYIACCEVLRAADLSQSISQIKAKTWVVSGQHDLAATVAQGQATARVIEQARFSHFECAHLVNWECTEAFNAQLLEFLLTP